MAIAIPPNTLTCRTPDTSLLHQVTAIGRLRSCFKEKFAIPRQPGLAPAARGVLELDPPFDRPEAVQGLEQVSHVWLLFLFHQSPRNPSNLRVRPPRLGGNQRIGVFASRSTHRPNGIGQSVVRLERVEPGRLWLSGIDLVDGTPILDVKPYLPYADCLRDAHNALAPSEPQRLTVRWNEQARQQAVEHGQRLGQALLELIEQCLAQDPRPAYQSPAADRYYGTRLWDTEVRWHYPRPDTIEVVEVIQIG